MHIYLYTTNIYFWYSLYSIGANLFENLARQKLNEFNENGLSDWKRSIIVHTSDEAVNDIHAHLDTLDEKRSKTGSSNESDLMSETAEVSRSFTILLPVNEDN